MSHPFLPPVCNLLQSFPSQQAFFDNFISIRAQNLVLMSHYQSLIFDHINGSSNATQFDIIFGISLIACCSLLIIIERSAELQPSKKSEVHSDFRKLPKFRRLEMQEMEEHTHKFYETLQTSLIPPNVSEKHFP